MSLIKDILIRLNQEESYQKLNAFNKFAVDNVFLYAVNFFEYLIEQIKKMEK